MSPGFAAAGAGSVATMTVGTPGAAGGRYDAGTSSGGPNWARATDELPRRSTTAATTGNRPTRAGRMANSLVEGCARFPAQVELAPVSAHDLASAKFFCLR